MVLSSQAGRQTNSRKYMYRRRRNRGTSWLVGIVVVVIAVGVGWWVIELNSTNQDAPNVQPEPAMSTTIEPVAEDVMVPAITMGQADDPVELEFQPVIEPVTLEPPVEEEIVEMTMAVEEPVQETVDTPVTTTDEVEILNTAPRNTTVASPVSDESESVAAATIDQAPAADPVRRRAELSALILQGGATTSQANDAFAELHQLNQKLLFSKIVDPNDSFVMTYAIKPNDNLELITKRNSPSVDWRFIQRINGIRNPNHIRIGQKLKMPVGTFHAFVNKSGYTLDLVQTNPQGDSIVIGRMPVGLGEYNSTPTGRFKIRRNSRLLDPSWTNPRTGEHFASNDPGNPIGEHWVGIEGVEESNKGMLGYGIHGTIDHGSIGKDASMGCIRLLPDDVALVWELLKTPDSQVIILP